MLIRCAIYAANAHDARAFYGDHAPSDVVTISMPHPEQMMMPRAAIIVVVV